MRVRKLINGYCLSADTPEEAQHLKWLIDHFSSDRATVPTSRLPSAPHAQSMDGASGEASSFPKPA